MAPYLLWIGRLLFVALLYGFLYQLYVELVRAHTAPPERGARLLLLANAPDGEVWVKDARGRERRLHPGQAAPVGDRFTLGRSVGAHVRLSDPYASHDHCLLRRRGGEWRVEDLATTNGTFVDGLPVEGEAPLRSGAVLQVGKTRFRFEVE